MVAEEGGTHDTLQSYMLGIADACCVQQIQLDCRSVCRIAEHPHTGRTGAQAEASEQRCSREQACDAVYAQRGRPGELLLTLLEWCECFTGGCPAAESISHVPPQHSSSSTRQSLPMHAHYSSHVCMRCVHSHGLSLLRCLCAMHNSLNL